MLLSSTEFRDSLQSSMKAAKQEVIVLSGFIKAEALKWLLDQCDSKNVTVVSRWRKHDLVCGASDFECYEICKKAGVRFGVSQNLHGKVYNIDQKIFVGSANLTGRGMAFSNNYNDEFGVGFTAGESDKSKLNFYLNEVIWLNEELAESIRSELEETPVNKLVSELEWSITVKSLLLQPVKYLWMHELLFCQPKDLLSFDTNNEHQIHDFEILGLNFDNLNRENLAQQFKQTNAFRWLSNQIKRNNSMRFGEISSHLHNSILDDPLPYRREVKDLVSNLYAWFELLSDEFEVSRPRHTQIIKYLEYER